MIRIARCPGQVIVGQFINIPGIPLAGDGFQDVTREFLGTEDGWKVKLLDLINDLSHLTSRWFGEVGRLYGADNFHTVGQGEIRPRIVIGYQVADFRAYSADRSRIAASMAFTCCREASRFRLYY